jgi:DNA polymerase-3 subunit epsilon
VEIFNRMPTGQTFHRYINPERNMPQEAFAVHGLSTEFLADKPLFLNIVEEFLEFIGDAPLVIHNASFDMKFVNSELHRCGKPPLPYARAIDTIEIAKARIPGARYSLDELCRRFGIDLSVRTKHGALLDAELTARVYLELVGGRQTKLVLAPGDNIEIGSDGIVQVARSRPQPLASLITPDERAAHDAFIAKELGSEPVWGWS